MTVSRTGRPPELNSDKYQLLLDAVPRVIIQQHVAYMARVSPAALSEWLTRGREEQITNPESIYAQFANDYHAARCAIIEEKLNIIATDHDNRAGNAWILEKCFREDFGKESEEMRELRALFMQLLPTLQGAQNGQQAPKGNTGTEPVPAESSGQA